VVERTSLIHVIDETFLDGSEILERIQESCVGAVGVDGLCRREAVVANKDVVYGVVQ